MTKSTKTTNGNKLPGTRRTSFRKYWQLHLMLLIPLVYILVFHYGPMVGLQIAFKDYGIKKGIAASPWVGFKHFRKFFSSYQFTELVRNTLSISLYSIFIGFPIPIILALLLHVCETPWLKKITQNVSYVPHFISMMVLVGMLNQILNPISGLYGTVYKMLGGTGAASDIRASASTFKHLYVWSGVWQNMGWDTIIYVAALCGVSSDLHEAAQLDGASRWKRIIHVDFPAILPTVCIMLILRCGTVMSVGYEKVYLMQNDVNLSVSEVISTYVYKVGLGKNQFSYATAVGLFNSVINSIVLLLVNTAARKASDGEQGLF